MPSFLLSALSRLPNLNSFNLYLWAMFLRSSVILVACLDWPTFFLICTAQKWTWYSPWGHNTDKQNERVTSRVLQAKLLFIYPSMVCSGFHSSLTLNHFQLVTHCSSETLFCSTRDHNYSSCHYTADCSYVQNLTLILAELHCILLQTISLKLLSDSAVSLFLEPLLLVEGG